MHILPYSSDHKLQWDRFVADSRNGTFMHMRDYMDYHADRFKDASFLIMDETSPVAVVPGSLHGEEWRSHGGLTYGGFIAGRDFKASSALEAMGLLRSYLWDAGCKRALFKPVPHIYHRMPAEEELYALFRAEAKLVRRDVSSSILLENKYAYSKGRKSSISKARREGVEVRKSDDLEAFMVMEESLLMAKRGLRPVHSGAEMRMLADRFPQNIQLHAAYLSGVLVAGVITYTTHTVCHAQYIASTAAGRDVGAVDAAVNLAIESTPAKWFDFGISTTDAGMVLDTALVANKEGYGARTICYDQYEIMIGERQSHAF